MQRVSFWIAAFVALFLIAEVGDAQTRKQPKQDNVLDQRIPVPTFSTTDPNAARARSAMQTVYQPGLREDVPGEYWRTVGPADQRPSGAQPFGPACTVDCTGALTEAETCGSSTNDGCSVDKCGALGTEALALGTSVCGEVYAENGLRDVDYYSLTLPTTTTLDISIQSNVPVVMQLVEDPQADCSSWTALQTVFSDDTCTPVTLSRTVLAGTYYLMVGISDETTIYFDGFPCGGNNQYRIDAVGAQADCYPACSGAGIELEVCGTDTNGGCNSMPVVAEPYVLNTITCGTSRTFFNTTTMAQNRDLDWYEFTVSDPSNLNEVEVDVSSEFPSLYLIVDTQCSGGNFYLFENNFTSNCVNVSSTVILPNGTYYFLIGPGDELGALFFGLECTDAANEYRFRIQSSAATGSCVTACTGIPTNTPEVCGVDSNNACATGGAPAPELVALDTPYCTQLWASGGTRDIDWYEFNIPALTDLTIEITATLPVFAFLTDDDCVAGPFLVSTVPFNSGDSALLPATTGNGDPVMPAGCGVMDSQTLSLSPGGYRLIMVPGWAFDPGLGGSAGLFDGAPCGFDNDVLINLVTSPPGSSACDVGLLCSVTGALPEPEACGDETNDWCWATVPPGTPELLTLGQNYCGSLKADSERDFDFYSFTLAAPTDVELLVTANLPTIAEVIPVTGFPTCPATLGAAATSILAADDCIQVASGPVSLAAGDYVVWLSTEDANGPLFGGHPCMTGNEYHFVLNDLGATPCDIVTGTCEPDCVTGDIVLDLTSQTALDAVEIDITDENGMSVASTSIPGPITAGQMLPQSFPGLPNGIYNVEITGTCPMGADPVVSVCTVALFTWNDPDSVIFTVEGLGGNQLLEFIGAGAIEALPELGTGNRGCIDSTAALEAALMAAGETVLVLPGQVALNNFPCITPNMGAGDILWVVQGSYPNNGPLLEAEGQMMADLLQLGVSIYQEGGDVWGFDLPTPFYDYDGIQGNFAAGGPVMDDGDDTFTEMIGSTLPPNLNTDVFGIVQYNQDNNNPAPFYAGGIDFTDQLLPAFFANDPLVDEAMPNGEAYEVWTNNDDGIPDPTVPEAQYATAMLHVTTDMSWMGGNVLVQSFEFGGLPAGQQNAIAAAYIGALRPTTTPMEVFKRGDCNGDGQTNIADAVRVLNVLFPQNCTPGVDCPTFDCEDACDANDDGTNNIADAVATLNVLFPQNCTPGVDCPVFPQPGNAACGEDQTMDSLNPCVYDPMSC